MAKKKNRPNPPKKNDSSIPYVERLAAERKEKEEQELLSDERVQKKLEELSNAETSNLTSNPVSFITSSRPFNASCIAPV